MNTELKNEVRNKVDEVKRPVNEQLDLAKELGLERQVAVLEREEEQGIAALKYKEFLKNVPYKEITKKGVEKEFTLAALDKLRMERRLSAKQMAASLVVLKWYGTLNDEEAQAALETLAKESGIMWQEIEAILNVKDRWLVSSKAFTVYCTVKCIDVKDYEAKLPFSVLIKMKEAKEYGFDTFQIWNPEMNVFKDPFLVGVKYDGDVFHCFEICRWE